MLFVTFPKLHATFTFNIASNLPIQQKSQVSAYRPHSGKWSHLLMIEHHCPASSPSHLFVLSYFQPPLNVKLSVITNVFHRKHINPPTVPHTGAHTQLCKKSAASWHISVLPIFEASTSPSITANYRSLHSGISKRLTRKCQSHWAAYWTQPSSVCVQCSRIDFQKATLLIHEGNMVAYIRAIWAN